RPVHVLPRLPAQGPVHHADPAARPGDPARCLRRGIRRLRGHGHRIGGGPARLEGKLGATLRSWGDDLVEEATRKLGERQARALLEICRDSIPETYKADVPAEYGLTHRPRVLNL